MILVALGFGLVGVAFLGLGLSSFFWDRRLLSRCSEVGEGVVSGFTEPDEEGFVRPRVRLVHGGKAITITGTVGFISPPPPYRVGQRVKVRYPPGRPGSAVVADFRNRYLFELGSIVLGAFGVGAAFLLFESQR